ncbi:MAG: ATPase, T2SS/T4P/T4SS family [Lachnospiraceae bacterium]|nr:ATPase, T2SS/T4P/T4SS family [Lachnospiraceae bacterium]
MLADESVTEIMVNGENTIFYERNGKLYRSDKRFDSKEQLNDIIGKIVSYANRTVNMRTPIVDARLKNGSRVNVVMEPISIDGTALTIRRFKDTPLTAENLINGGSVSSEIMLLLSKLVHAGYNILISGSTGSGKTTLLNILTGYIPKDERIITIEDSAELRITGIDNLVRMETRNASSDGGGEIHIRDLIRAALRMRPDRIIVGEVRGSEAIDMLQSFSVGQDGSMSTIHANSSEDALYRLEMLLMMGDLNMPLSAMRRQISIGVDIIVHIGRMKDKSRKVLEVREVLGYELENVKTHLLYRYENSNFVKYGDVQNTYKLERAALA